MLSHSSIALLLVTLKYECMHLRLDQVNRLHAIKVISNFSSKILDLELDLADFCINLLEVRTELRINDVVILFGLAYIYALLEHLFQLRKVFEGALELIEDLGSQGMVLVHHVLIEVATQLLQGEDHIVNLHTIYQLGIVSQLGLHSVELCIKLLQIWELYKI